MILRTITPDPQLGSNTSSALVRIAQSASAWLRGLGVSNLPRRRRFERLSSVLEDIRDSFQILSEHTHFLETVPLTSKSEGRRGQQDTLCNLIGSWILTFNSRKETGAFGRLSACCLGAVLGFYAETVPATGSKRGKR